VFGEKALICGRSGGAVTQVFRGDLGETQVPLGKGNDVFSLVAENA
jgi:hypothetical protein